jgi:hypothetical protein
MSDLPANGRIEAVFRNSLLGRVWYAFVRRATLGSVSDRVQRAIELSRVHRGKRLLLAAVRGSVTYRSVTTDLPTDSIVVDVGQSRVVRSLAPRIMACASLFERLYRRSQLRYTVNAGRGWARKRPIRLAAATLLVFCTVAIGTATVSSSVGRRDVGPGPSRRHARGIRPGTTPEGSVHDDCAAVRGRSPPRRRAAVRVVV